ncbi:hypothetical protein TEA_011471 [Camellia sinensis var. sinensis]|uniref:Uncharacterized protein n=1 Tax=Camellia sinensis var. sinensis TaxID=542762 RepID=A0A4S4DJE8_CAMSN|nr:hypothetical protein TEA_011471 [Camellia sinensis var. sinensis]
MRNAKEELDTLGIYMPQSRGDGQVLVSLIFLSRCSVWAWEWVCSYGGDKSPRPTVFNHGHSSTTSQMNSVLNIEIRDECIIIFPSWENLIYPLSRTAGPGMIITLHADLDLFQDQFHHPLMREIIGQTRSPQGIPDPFQGLFLHARREITGQTTGPQARERMVVVPVMRGMMNPAGHRALGEMGGVPQGLIHDPTVLADGCST